MKEINFFIFYYLLIRFLLAYIYESSATKNVAQFVISYTCNFISGKDYPMQPFFVLEFERIMIRAVII